MLRNAKYTQYDAQDITRLYFTLIDLIRETHGAAGVAEFEQAYHNPQPRRKNALGCLGRRAGVVHHRVRSFLRSQIQSVPARSYSRWTEPSAEW